MKSCADCNQGSCTLTHTRDLKYFLQTGVPNCNIKFKPKLGRDFIGNVKMGVRKRGTSSSYSCQQKIQHRQNKTIKNEQTTTSLPIKWQNSFSKIIKQSENDLKIRMLKILKIILEKHPQKRTGVTKQELVTEHRF